MKSNEIITKSIGYQVTETDDYYIINFLAETDYPDYFINRIKETMDKISVNEESLNRKIKVLISDLIWLFDDIELINNAIIEDVLDYGIVITDMIKVYKRLDADIASKIIDKLDNKLLTISEIKSPKCKNC